MEKLKSVIPETLRGRISESSVNDLQSTCSSLLNFLENLPLFHQFVSDLTNPDLALCGKNKDAAMETKAKANECFGKGDYSSALRFYSQSLRIAPIDAEDKYSNLMSTLYLNRSSTLHKLGFLMESLRDCNRALILSPAYAKAWYRRGKTNSSLGNSEDAIKDFSISLNIEESLAGRRQIECELDILLEQPVIRRNSICTPNENSLDESVQVELQCVSGKTKGRGMVASIDIRLASLVHKEDPYAAIILKPCRETHCASCFNELPIDTVPCLYCSIPLYCSVKCQFEAGGEDFSMFKDNYGSLEQLPVELVQHIRNVTSLGKSNSESKQFAEHRHECRGMNWSAVLPPNVVLAGRILVKHIEKQIHSHIPKSSEVLDLCQNYGQLSSERKLEFHVYSIILLYCLHQFYASELPLDSAIVSQIIVLLSQIRINTMAIVRMKYSDGKEPLGNGATSSIEQVQVAQAIYSKGSLYNHSCQPNIHAYFLSRTLFIRVTQNVIAGSELELSYGPQVGQWNCSERQKFLVDSYSFRCECSGCSEVTLSDLVHSGYRCKVPSCNGVVLDGHIAECEKEKLQLSWSKNSQNQEHVFSYVRIGRVAHLLVKQISPTSPLIFDHCLNCGSFCDLQASQRTINKAEINIRRLQDYIACGEIPPNAIMDGVKSLSSVRTVLHPLNKRIAEVEDVVAQAFCLVGDMQGAKGHSKASLEILETLYGENHITVGNELIKLASIQLSVGDEGTAAESVSRLRAIISIHYGSHANAIVPHLLHIKREEDSKPL